MKTIKNLEFPDLGYSYDSLEPYIDATTTEIHYTRHHKAYFGNLKAAVEGTDLENETLENIFKDISKYPVAVRNNGGGHYNHTLFWSIMSPDGGGRPSGKLLEAITAKFGTFEEFQSEFETAAKTRFGSGWAWLCVDDDKSLSVCSSPNQDNPLMDIHNCKGTPILCLDVWEHAYYLKYQNKRPDYVSAFWNVVDWSEVEANYNRALVAS